MVKKTERKVNVSGKPKHSLDAKRSDAKAKNKDARTGATVRRLKMYNTRPKQNTRVSTQQELDIFREEHSRTVSKRETFSDVFGRKTKRKRPKLLAADYESLAKKADGSQDVFQEKHADDSVVEGSEADGFRDLVRHTMFEKGQSKHIWGELYKVIDSSDVVVQVLDARDPQGTRCHHLERHLKEHCTHKHLILLLNKCDLVPPWVLSRWLNVLKAEFPTIAFHASVNKSFGKVCKVAPIPGETKCGSNSI
ncbi:nucleolar GTP-binding protein 2 [Pyrus ussuriensis x Pyrus communis]|uniref:Nuclear/nucleolar GTPase 2 n=1 Tax=Pyrus ussuriensis x Pyrus communis TaxID=2448454 RepID=A0A5N5GPP0_9ROSA|nr:nucleolar GTP-binding protein 2 [Pyrus ussuriensis x Pyrus communis]